MRLAKYRHIALSVGRFVLAVLICVAMWQAISWALDEIYYAQTVLSGFVLVAAVCTFVLVFAFVVAVNEFLQWCAPLYMRPMPEED